jgi:lysozyme
MLDVIADLSHWQSGPAGKAIDFAAMKAAGIAAVLLKATQGSSWIDATFVQRAVAAREAGLLVGAYHFVDASAPLAQANHFLTVAGGISRLAVDIEPNGMGDTVSIAQAAEIVARIQMATARLPLVYIGRDGPSGTGAGLPNSVLSRCPLWLPEYGVSSPTLPAGWPTWHLWQHTETGSVPGVAGDCDRSYYNGILDGLTAWWSSST